jgi:hypothetical protein
VKNFERSEIQPILQNAIVAALKQNEIEVEGAHVRRVVRSLLRLAAKVMLSASGATNPAALAKGAYLPLCMEAFAKEFEALHGKVPVEGAVAEPKGSN